MNTGRPAPSIAGVPYCDGKGQQMASDAARIFLGSTLADHAEATTGSLRRHVPVVFVERVQVEPGMTVLDLGSGLGEAALALARAVGPAGHVTATDASAGRLAIAEERAGQLGLTNLTFRVANAHELPFPDGAFDRVACAADAMRSLDFPRALRESCRVLKPGGRATFAAWASPRGAFVGTLAAALRAAGFAEVEADVVATPAACSGRIAVISGIRPRRPPAIRATTGQRQEA